MLSLAGNRELNLKRRDLLRSDLNTQYAALCNPSTPVSKYLFGDDLNKEMEDLSKASKLTKKVTPSHRMEPYRRPVGTASTYVPSRSSNYSGRGSRLGSGAFLGFGRGQSRNYQRNGLKFLWRDQLYAFTCLPMGLTSSPRIFTKILKPVFATLCSTFGHSCLGYIDDSLNLGDTYTEAEKATLHAVELLISLGFMIHP